MNFISEIDRQLIENAVRNIETKTRGELVTVITQSSDDYDDAPYMWGALITLFGAALAFIIRPDISYEILIPTQIVVFLLLSYILHIPALKLKLVPAPIKSERAARLAREQFYEQNVHETTDRSGILIFVSVAERYVEIIADKGINEKIKHARWQEIIDQFILNIRDKNTAKGFVTAIELCGDILADNFPINADDKNELPNRLVIL